MLIGFSSFEAFVCFGNPAKAKIGKTQFQIVTESEPNFFLNRIRTKFLLKWSNCGSLKKLTLIFNWYKRIGRQKTSGFCDSGQALELYQSSRILTYDSARSHLSDQAVRGVL